VYSSHASQQRRAALAAEQASATRLKHQQHETRVADASLSQTAAQARAQAGPLAGPLIVTQRLATASQQLAANEGELVKDGESGASVSVYNAAVDKANHQLDEWRSLLQSLEKVDSQLVF
jgi:hypothetical protein